MRPVANDIASARARLAEWKDRAHKHAADTQTAGTALQNLTATAQDRLGITEVTLDASGAITNIVFTRAAEREHVHDLPSSIMEAYSNAGRLLVELAREAVADSLGDESATGKAMVEAIRSRTGYTDDDDEDRGGNGGNGNGRNADEVDVYE